MLLGQILGLSSPDEIGVAGLVPWCAAEMPNGQSAGPLDAQWTIYGVHDDAYGGGTKMENDLTEEHRPH